MKPQHQARSLGDDPLAAESELERFYKPAAALAAVEEPASRPKPEKADKPTHYKVVCISLYTEDIAHLEELVAELKRRGHSKANKSQLIRAALAQVDLAKIPKGF
jgi:hypothetical protein